MEISPEVENLYELPRRGLLELLRYRDQLLDQNTLVALKKVRSLTYEKLKSMEYQDWSEYCVKGLRMKMSISISF